MWHAQPDFLEVSFCFVIYYDVGGWTHGIPSPLVIVPRVLGVADVLKHPV